MGLKGFHVVFITVCTLLSVSVAAWCWREGAPLGVAASVAAGVALLIYGNWFLKKMARLP